MTETKQLTIVHLSDLHFGDNHLFQPPKQPDGKRTDEHHPKLEENLQADFADVKPGIFSNVIAAITGDITQTANAAEFLNARDSIEGLLKKPVLGQDIGKDRVFIVPGNHDLNYSANRDEERWLPYCTFYRSLFGSTDPRRQIDERKPECLNRVHDRTDDLGLVLVEINSAFRVKKDTDEEHRGRIDSQDLAMLRQELSNIGREKLRENIKIALVHHHPVLIPPFAESGRAYDAIVNSASLLNLLTDFGFHAVLHGHKHYPHTFLYDATCGWAKQESAPLMIVAGGSVSSEELPNGFKRYNTYNVITISHRPRAKQTRVRVDTRALEIHDEEENRKLLPQLWKWRRIKRIDRLLTLPEEPKNTNAKRTKFDETEHRPWQTERIHEYARLRGNMPVVEVVPSLMPGQELEAQVWIAPHAASGTVREIPKSVTWFAGERFSVHLCEQPAFAAVMHYYSPMNVQARITFEDGTTEIAYAYAHAPEANI